MSEHDGASSGGMAGQGYETQEPGTMMLKHPTMEL